MNRYWVCKADLQLPWHGRPVNRVAVSPIGESLAAATTVGLYTVSANVRLRGRVTGLNLSYAERELAHQA
jgi:hypothetical protein